MSQRERLLSICSPAGQTLTGQGMTVISPGPSCPPNNKKSLDHRAPLPANRYTQTIRAEASISLGSLPYFRPVTEGGGFLDARLPRADWPHEAVCSGERSPPPGHGVH